MNERITFEEFRERVSGGIVTEGGSCPVTQVTRMLQGKWKLQIIYELCVQSPLRFGELRRALGEITNTMLASALKELEADGLVHREEYPQVPPKVEYSLTGRGRSLMPILDGMCEWGEKNR